MLFMSLLLIISYINLFFVVVSTLLFFFGLYFSIKTFELFLLKLFSSSSFKVNGVIILYLFFIDDIVLLLLFL